jgi:hypothetical protein
VCERCGWEHLEPAVSKTALDAANAMHRHAELSDVTSGTGRRAKKRDRKPAQ